MLHLAPAAVTAFLGAFALFALPQVRRAEGAAPPPGADPEAPKPHPAETARPSLHRPSEAADPDFPPKSPARPGDWLYSFEERGQTVDEYREECLNRKGEGRETIVLQPLGGILERNADVMKQTREYVGLFYGCQAEVAEPAEMPAEALDRRRMQYDADRILVVLRNRIPGKALAYAGFCEEDLFAGDLNYVFGVGELRRRVGVYALARYGKKEERSGGEPTFLKRTLKVASHEIGHMLGMEHCVRYECSMNGSNSVREMDRQPMHLCPECLEKARWNTGLDVKGRYEKLAAFYEKAGLAADGVFARRQAARGSRQDAKNEEGSAKKQ